MGINPFLSRPVRSNGQILLGGTLSPEEVEEFDALDEICYNLTDADGTTPNSHVKFIERRTQLLRKARIIRENQSIFK